MTISTLIMITSYPEVSTPLPRMKTSGWAPETYKLDHNIDKSKYLFHFGVCTRRELENISEAQTVLCDPSASFYTAEIALAIQFLHSNGAVHRYLKLDNVLLDKEGHVKMTDFGLSAVAVYETDRITGFCGSPEYMAPEVVLRQQYGHAIDWWVLGIVIFEMAVGFPRFIEDDDSSLLEVIVTHDVKYPEWFSDKATSIMEGFLRRDLLQRLTQLEEIMCHPFFGNIEWEHLENRNVPPPFLPAYQKRCEHHVNISAILTPDNNSSYNHLCGFTLQPWESTSYSS